MNRSMNLATKAELETLILQQAIRNHQSYIARCARRVKEAEADLVRAIRDADKDSQRLQALRARRQA